MLDVLAVDCCTFCLDAWMGGFSVLATVIDRLLGLRFSVALGNMAGRFANFQLLYSDDSESTLL